MATVEAALQAMMGIAWRRQWHGCGSSGDSAAALVVAIARQQWPAWQHGGSAVSLVASPRGGGGTNNQQSTKRATATATKTAMMKAMK
jgi:hypothetical protein